MLEYIENMQKTFFQKIIFLRKTFLYVFLFLFFLPVYGFAQDPIYIDASTLLAKANLFVSPQSATVLEGAIIEIPVFIDTKGRSINTIDLTVNFDQKKLAIVSPSSNNSIIAIWVDPPTYSNTTGVMKLSGVIPDGVTTNSGLITTMTFRAIATGQANVIISTASRVLANDGQGSEVQTSFNRGTYTVVPKPPEGVRVFSETHSFEDTWYNNKNPIIGWDKAADITDFSFELDNKPFTVPDNIPDTIENTTSYQNLGDGVWYFHIKARKQGVWGAVTHFMIHIDTQPPAIFRPKAEIVSLGDTHKAFISFFTTDLFSGLDHYEVGVLKSDAGPTDSPVFVQVESPYQLPVALLGDTRVTIRAFDRAGNSIDETINVTSPLTIVTFIEQNWIIILLLLMLLFHYFFGHKLIPHMKRILRIAKEEEAIEKNMEEKITIIQPKVIEPQREILHQNISIPESKSIEPQPITVPSPQVSVIMPPELPHTEMMIPPEHSIMIQPHSEDQNNQTQ